MAVETITGAQPAWFVEYDEAPARILTHHWPDVPNLGDVTSINWENAPTVDILTGGYPCQPFSQAGRRKGEDDERHLWPYVREAIRHLRPRFTLLENVAGHRSLGFDRVLADLAKDGLHAKWTSIRASDVGAPHRRERVFILAYSDSIGCDWRRPAPQQTTRAQSPTDRLRPAAWGDYEPAIRSWEHVTGADAPYPTEPGRRGNPRLSARFAEWMMGLPAGWVTSPSIGLTRAQQLKALGNGVVPQQAAFALNQLLGEP